MMLLFWGLLGCALSNAFEFNSADWGTQRSVERDAKAARRAETSSTHWRDQQEEARKGLHPSKWTGNLSPDWDPYANVEGGYGHGNVTHSWGKTWKWQQVGMGVTIGIPIDDWDDQVHTKSEQFLAWTDNPEHYSGPEDEQSQALQPRTTNAGPGWNARLCRAVIACARPYMGHIDFGNGWAQVVHAVAKYVPYGKRFYDWAHEHPFSVSILTTVGGYGLGYSHGGATAQDNDQLSQCSTTDNEEDACIVAFTKTGASPHQAARVDITLPDGHILAFSGMVYQKTSSPPNDMCGVRGDAP